ncbi:phage portal protein BeeE [Rhizobium rhizoryzae]|uniref:Phage portal protein BeeE n=3 Tax=Rhizobium TaxID=379 RepID=A0A7W6PR83_9HYPH|nr:phage portal protein BeeE [Rhizobium rhizoryzae]
MNLFRWPWASTDKGKAVAASERKAQGVVAGLGAGGALALLTGERGNPGGGRSYASLARHGLMRNPVAYRAVRMVAEAAASAP